MPVIEISVDSLESALAAERGGAHRVELCSALQEGGLTPSLGLIRAARAQLSVGLYILIRPRPGDFLYSDDEFRILREDLRIAAQEGVNGVVLGLLTADGEVDTERTQELVELARPLEVTFHRAFDMARDPLDALAAVIACGADRVLTSGGAPSAMRGRDQLRQLVQVAGEQVNVLVGGGVRPDNIAELARHTGAAEFHSSMRHTEPSAMRFRVPHLNLGAPGTDEYSRTTVLADEVRALVQAAQARSQAVPGHLA